MNDRSTFESIGQIAERVVRKTEVMQEITDPWAWWRAAVDNPKQIGKTLIMTSTPEQGFYRYHHTGGPWIPVAIWFDNGWRGLEGQEPDRRKIKDVERAWEWCRAHPISQDWYERVAERGEPWPDVDEVVHAQRTPPKPGDNSGDLSESQMLAGDIQAALDQLRAYKAITSDDMAGKAQSLRARLNELSGKADKIREKAVRPHLDAQKAINGEWQPLVKDAKAGADTLRKSLEAYETAKLRERRAAEDAARKAEEREAEISFARGEPGLEVVAPPAEPAPTQVKGAYGKAAHVGTQMVVKEIVDQDKLYGFLRDHPDLRACMLDLAKRALKGGYTDIPGVRIEEEATVR